MTTEIVCLRPTPCSPAPPSSFTHVHRCNRYIGYRNPNWHSLSKSLKLRPVIFPYTSGHGCVCFEECSSFSFCRCSLVMSQQWLPGISFLPRYPVQTGDQVDSNRWTTSPARAGTGRSIGSNASNGEGVTVGNCIRWHHVVVSGTLLFMTIRYWCKVCRILHVIFLMSQLYHMSLSWLICE